MTVQNIEIARTDHPSPAEPSGAAATSPQQASPAVSVPVIGSLRQEIDRLFEQFTSRFWSRPFDLQPPFRFEMPFGTATPAVDVAELDGAYEVSAELPGLEPKDVHVSVSDGVLTISGEKSEEKEETARNYRLSERRFGSFRRSFQLPDGVEADKIEASFAKGVLKVTLPRRPAAAAAKTTIEVKAA